MVKKALAKQVSLEEEPQPKSYRRMTLVAETYGVKVATLKALINSGKLTRYKLGAVTLIDTREFETLIIPDLGNHGPEAAPKASRG